jgi:hypothetical protein
MPFKVWPFLFCKFNQLCIMASKNFLGRSTIEYNFRNARVAREQQIKVIRSLRTANDGTV